jgi:diguanylate cyclase (GGDEF)-like protein/PAS domain S-box-containing protein
MFWSLRLVGRFIGTLLSRYTKEHLYDNRPFGLEDRHRIETQTELLNETLQLANYSAVTHLAVIVALPYMFWDCASRIYLSCLAVVVSLIIVATLYTTWHYKNAFREAVDERAIRHAFRTCQVLALALGLAWATMPAVLLPPSDGGYRMIVAATTAGLISNAYVVGPIFSVALLLSAPIVIGAFLGLAGCEAPFSGYVSLLLGVYAAFIFFSVRRMIRLSYQRIWQRVLMQHQGETIGLLLNDFEEGASDWLWETDPQGALRHVSARMAATLGLSAADLQQRSLENLIRDYAASDDADDGAEAALSALTRKRAFCDLPIRLRTDAGVRWWNLNGKPTFDRHGNFTGYRGVGADITLSQEAQAHIAFLASHDTLTGLPNRAAFQHAVHSACLARTLGQSRTALLCLDLDGFKAVNDSRGHSTGDQLLQSVAQRLRAIAGCKDQVFRLGGDEFALLQNCIQPEQAEILAECIVEELRRPYRIGTAHLEIGVSVGIAYAPHDAQDAASLLSRADLALYSAKAAGKGRWRSFESGLEDLVLRARELDADMRLALGTDEMQLHYQPLVDLDSERVIGFEALLRWQKPGAGWISPAEIIPIAESTGFIIEIGRWALRRACTDALSWPSLRIAVNISSIHVRCPTFYDDVADALRDTGLAPERLEIEITESVLLDRETLVLDNLKRLRQLSVRIALDDFGTGYSSLSYLTEFPFDKVKVDRSFVRDLQQRPEKIAVIEAIAAMARALSMDLTVEGVETRQQSDVLKLKGCGTAQGYLYSPARPFVEINDLVRRLESTAASVRKTAALIEAA